jgi:hypothetical protein
VGFHEIDFFTIGIGEFFHLRNHLGGISWDWFFHHRNRWIFSHSESSRWDSTRFIFSPSESSRWDFMRLIFSPSESVNFSPSESSRWDFARWNFSPFNHFKRILFTYLLFFGA